MGTVKQIQIWSQGVAWQLHKFHASLCVVKEVSPENFRPNTPTSLLTIWREARPTAEHKELCGNGDAFTFDTVNWCLVGD